MAASEQAPARSTSLAHFAGSAAGSIAVGIAALYAIGSALLCVHDASYGVFEFDLLRPRVLLIGFTFAALCGLPAVANHYKLSYFGPLKSVVEDSAPERQHQRKIVLGFGFAYTAWLIALYLNFFLFYTRGEYTAPWWKWAIPNLAAILVLIGLYWLVSRIFARHPWTAASLAIIATGLFVALLDLAGYISRYAEGTNTANLILFFLLVGSVCEDAAEHGSWSWVLSLGNLLGILIVLAFYVITLFGAIQPRFGGGAPQPVVIYLNSQAAWLKAGPVDGYLIDETGRGLYILPSLKGKALFLPSGNIAAVYYGPNTDLPK